MINVSTYNELEEYFEAFGSKDLNFLVIVSRGGLGKTYTAKHVTSKHDPLYLSGHLTPLEFYKRLMKRNRREDDFLFVLDDIDSFIDNKMNTALLKQVADTKENKTIKYYTSSPRLDEDEDTFTTRCKSLILMNKTPRTSSNKDLAAIMDRALVVKFTPTNEEIMNRIKSFAKDEEIVKFLEREHKSADNLSLRTYVKAKEIKEAGLDWKNVLAQELTIPEKFIEMIDLFEDDDLASDKERIKEFSGSRRTYYRTKKDFLEKYPKYKN